MRELNPAIPSPGEILFEIRALRAQPLEHQAAVQAYMAKAAAAAEVLGAIENPSTATLILHAYAIRTGQLLEHEANQTRGDLES